MHIQLCDAHKWVFFARDVCQHTSMEFLRDCARRLDDGEEAGAVLASMRERYTTLRCLNSKTCLVRRMCKLNPAFVERARGDVDCVDLLRGVARPPADFPPRLPANVRGLALPRAEAKQCKRMGVASALAKNKSRVRVDGRAVLRCCREEVDAVLDGARPPSPLFALSLMLLTGRRTCEVLNGASVLEARGEYAVAFRGQAKRRRADPGYEVPVLHAAARLVRAMDKLRAWTTAPPPTTHHLTHNQATSNKYQSWLSRTLAAHPVLASVGKPHALRGLYACMCYRLFSWDKDYTEAYVVMHILGHTGLGESLVYTPFNLGDAFAREEAPLGPMTLEVPPPVAVREEVEPPAATETRSPAPARDPASPTAP